MLENYGYLNDILKQMLNFLPLKITRIDQLGSRKSGKTIQDFDFHCKAIVLPKVKVKVYVFRNMSEQLYDTWKQLKNRWVSFAIGLNYYISETRKTIRFNNSEIECRSLYKQNNKNVKLTGLPDNTMFDYVVRHIDERFEISQKDEQDLSDSIRGCKQLLEINSCNPWSALNEYIKSIIEYLPQNENLIINKYEQFYINYIDKRIIHYQNWKLNIFLPIHEQEKLLELEKLDPISARVRSHGLVGYESGGIYSHLIHKISRLLQPYYYYSAGLDYGFKDDSMATILVGFDKNFNFVNVIDCLKIENKLIRYDNKQLAQEIIKFFQNATKSNPGILVNGLIVYCDYSNYTFIEMLNDCAIKNNCHTWLYFRDCVKLKLEFRIGKNIALMASERLNISLKSEDFLKELRFACWDEKSLKQVPLPGNDHLRDSFDYAIAPYIRQLNANLNPYFER